MMFLVSDQLELALLDLRLKCSPNPWSGRSPRELTKGWIRCKLKAQGGGHEVDLRQLDFFVGPGGVPVSKKVGPSVSAAPTLLPLPPRRY